MRVLITGAAGFIGSHVVRAFAQRGHTIFALTRTGGKVEVPSDCRGEVHPVKTDLNHHTKVRALVRQTCPELAVHLAWYAIPGKYWTAPENLDCVAASLNLAGALADAGCRRLVVAGSCAEYDWDHGFLSEKYTPLRPRTLYGTCKNALREMLEAHCARTSMQCAWTRFFYLYGPGEDNGRLVPSVILSLLQGQVARCTLGEQLRDFLYVEDAAAALAAVAASDFTGAINIGSGQAVPVRAIVDTIAGILDQRDRVLLGAIPENPAEPPLLVADVRSLTQTIGWKPSRTLEEGLFRTVAWWDHMQGRTAMCDPDLLPAPPVGNEAHAPFDPHVITGRLYFRPGNEVVTRSQ
jgi:nucleoside-diphosphate-sugar epimerase